MESDRIISINENKKKINFVPLLLFVMFYITEVIVQILFINHETGSFYTLSSVVWFTSKFVPLVMAIIIFRKYFLEKFNFTKNNLKSFFLFTLASFGIFYCFELASSYYQMLMDKIYSSGEASNQEGIYEYFRESSTFINYFVLFLSIVVVAPILEELEFRTLIFKAFDGFHFLAPSILSALIFGLAHLSLLSNDEAGNLIFNYTEFIYFPVYFIPGFCLSLIYHYGKNNIFSTMAVHMAINLISFTAIVLKGF